MVLFALLLVAAVTLLAISLLQPRRTELPKRMSEFVTVPGLSPQQVKRILIDTADRLPSVEIDRQGWGVIAPRRAVELALALRPQ